MFWFWHCNAVSAHLQQHSYDSPVYLETNSSTDANILARVIICICYTGMNRNRLIWFLIFILLIFLIFYIFILCLVILLISETQAFWKKRRLSEKVTIGPSFCMNFFSLPSSLHEFFFLAFSLAWIFFWGGFLHPPPPIHFSNGPSLNPYIIRPWCNYTSPGCRAQLLLCSRHKIIKKHHLPLLTASHRSQYSMARNLGHLVSCDLQGVTQWS